MEFHKEITGYLEEQRTQEEPLFFLLSSRESIAALLRFQSYLLDATEALERDEQALKTLCFQQEC